MAEVLGLLPKIAADVALWFPELEGRSLAVSDADQLSRENTPRLPLVMVALSKEQSDQGLNLSTSILNIIDEFVVEFWLEPNRYKRANGTESPFWTYFDYEKIRDILLTGFANGYLGPNQERISYRRMQQEASEFAVVLTFTFRASYQWCPSQLPAEECVPDMPGKDGAPITSNSFDLKLCTPKNKCLPQSYEP